MKRQRITERRGGTVVDGNKQCKDISLVQDGMPTNAGDIDKMHTIIASRDQELSQAALRVILSKRAKLV